MVSMLAGAGVNSADQHWPWWPLLPLGSWFFSRGLRGLSLICFQIFVRLGWSEFNWENMKAVLISCSRKKPVRDR